MMKWPAAGFVDTEIRRGSARNLIPDRLKRLTPTCCQQETENKPQPAKAAGPLLAAERGQASGVIYSQIGPSRVMSLLDAIVYLLIRK
jgi:hypothetical protein